MPCAPAASPHALRAACLRGVSLTLDGPRAVVSLSAEQHLVLPLPAADLPRWQARVGRRVWLDMGSQSPCLLADPLPGVPHG
jgi:hypothetical protein